jgi:hypothetical protein
MLDQTKFIHPLIPYQTKSPTKHDQSNIPRYAASQSSAGGGPVAREAVEVLEDLEAGRGEADPDLQVCGSVPRRLALRDS